MPPNAACRPRGSCEDGGRRRRHAPVAAGDRIRFRAWAERKAIIDPCSNWGLLIGRCAGVNQDDLPVVTFEAQLLLERRPPLAT